MPRLPEALYAAGHKPFDSQIELLIALSRVAIAIFSLVTFYVDPLSGGKYSFAIGPVLIAYTGFALIVALIPTIGRVRTGWQLPAHVFDIGLISLLLFLLETGSRQFFLLYAFVLLGATIRWNWRGAAATTILLLGLGLLLAILSREFGSIHDDQNLATLNIVVYSTFVLMIGGIFTFFGAARERSQMRLAELAAWPAPAADARGNPNGPPLDAALTHVARVLQVPRALVIWEQSDEPFLYIALLADGRCHPDRKPADAFGDWTAPDLAATAFASADVNSKKFFTAAGVKSSKNILISPSLESQFQLKSVASAPFTGELCTGRVFMLDKSSWDDDDLALTEIVASRIASELEHYALGLQLADTATAMERMRLARDLHDGILQSLTAAGLHLKAIAPDVGDGSESTIENVRRLLLDEQQRIRHFVEERQDLVGSQTLALHSKMQALIDKNRRHWGCDIALSMTSEDTEIGSELARQLDFILAEAIANAVRHGEASRIDVTAQTSSDRVLLWIKDNGHGLMGTTGAYSATELAARKIGPASLRNRIVELGGSLILSSSREGVELRIDLPT